ncbi:MAG: hypothetical protein A2W95_09825 [Bacteroidetes bacterium GWA2_40_14]|nr:MAG: hypothetical protein A2W95_09825 [Bacteroidetes bacterium GWA2_40_14]
MKQYLIFLFLLLISLGVFGQSKLDSLLNLVDTTRIDTQIIDIYFQIAEQLHKTDNKQSIIYAEKGLKLSELLNDSSRIAHGNLKWGTALSNLSYYYLAMDKYIKCKEIAEAMQDSSRLGQVLNNIGNIYWFQKNYETALKFYNNALPYAKATNNQSVIIGLYLNMGLAYQYLSVQDSSEYYLNHALYMAKTNKDSVLMGLILVNKGETLLNSKEYGQLEKTLKEVQEYETILSFNVRVLLHNSFAQLYMAINQIQKAKENLEISEGLVNQSGSLFSLNAYLRVKFQYDTLTRNYPVAIETLNRILKIQESISNTEIANKIASFQAMYELQEKETEIRNLKSQNEIYTLRNRQNRLWLLVLVVVFISAATIIVIVFKSIKQKNRSIEVLNTMNQELKSHKEELTSLNEELAMNQEELYEKNQHLEKTISQLNTTQNHLFQVEKMASLGVLSRGVAHEIINPLNFINGGIALIEEAEKEDMALAQKLEIPLKMMNEGINRAVDIVRQLSAFVDQGNTRPQLANINQIIDGTLVFLNYRIDLETKLIKEYAPLPESYCFPDKIHSIVFQLLTNAIDAVKDSSGEKVIKVCTKLLKDTAGEVFEIKIYNTGEPIKPDVLPKIFDPFFTTKDANKGTGMGLTLVYNLVKEQQGDLLVQNLDQGVMFTVTLPRVEKI